MKNKTITGEIVTEYLQKYPNLMKLTLARLIYKEHPEAFVSVDNVRNIIRYYTNSLGSYSRKALADKRFVECCQPQSYKEERQDYVLPKVNNDILFLPDMHVPYHDTEAIKASLEWGKTKKINTIVIGGDFMDMYQLSTFVKDPRMRDLRDELDAGYEMMYYISNFLPHAKIFFLPGNHEYRLERYLKLKAPELLGASGDELGLDFFLKLSDFGVSYLKNAQIIKAGKLFIGHGHEFHGGAGGVNPARTFMLRSNANFIGGHFHRSAEDSNRKLNGDVDCCWSVGCLCGLTPEYQPFNKWNHGFARIKIHDDGTFNVFNAKIFNGTVL